jgi:anti-sigma regulatory factor (Ser/Thr protein kinase)
MFVTCLYILLDPQTGEFTFANAGHNLPIKRSHGQVQDLRATGMPLGLLPGMTYEEKQAHLEPGESLLLYSDGLVEAHDPQNDMFGFPRLHQEIAGHASGEDLIAYLMSRLADFTGAGWEQEDDVTLVSLEHTLGQGRLHHRLNEIVERGPEWQLLADFHLASQPGNERQAMEQVATAVEPLDLPAAVLERLKTAVGETTMNAMEHGNRYQADLPARIQVLASSDRLAVLITDYGGDYTIPEYVSPDLEAKLAGLQSPRGWGLFLIQNMVDEVNIHSDADHHTVELIIHLEATKS